MQSESPAKESMSSGYLPSSSPPTPPTTPQQVPSMRTHGRHLTLAPSTRVKNDFSSLFNGTRLGENSCKEAAVNSLPISLSSPSHLSSCDSHPGSHFAEHNANWPRFVESHAFYASDPLTTSSPSLMNESQSLLANSAMMGNQYVNNSASFINNIPYSTAPHMTNSSWSRFVDGHSYSHPYGDSTYPPAPVPSSFHEYYKRTNVGNLSSATGGAVQAFEHTDHLPLPWATHNSTNYSAKGQLAFETASNHLLSGNYPMIPSSESHLS